MKPHFTPAEEWIAVLLIVGSVTVLMAAAFAMLLGWEVG